MKRKIIFSLLLLLLVSAPGPIVAIFSISNTNEMLSRLVTLHQIEALRRDLISTVQTAQSDLHTIHTQLGHGLDEVVDNIAQVSAASAICDSCHHAPDVAQRIGYVQHRVEAYRDALSYYITASANKERIFKLHSDADAIGKEILAESEAMSRQATRTLEKMTALSTERVQVARAVLFITLLITLILGAVVALHLIRSATGPIERLVTATRAISAGNLDHAVEADGRTEFGELAKHFNHMSVTLKKNYEKLAQEIQERRQAEAALRESEERYALASQGANDGLWDWDIRDNRAYYSYRWKSMLGYAETEIGEHLEDWLDRIHPDDREGVKARLAAHIDGQIPHFEAEFRIRHKDDGYRWALSRGLAVRDDAGRAHRMAGSQTDITARKNAEAQLIHNAFHDVLTGLPNRALFIDRLKHVISTSKRRANHQYAIMFTDLDRFKVVNDSMGHTVGDGLLMEMGRRLAQSLRPGDTVARLGGDEFAILLDDISGPDNAAEVADRILGSLTAPCTLHGREIVTSASIGIAFKSPLYEHPEQVLRDADIAMYQAKARGRNRYEFFDAELHASILDRLQLEGDLRVALENRQELVVHYQPIVNLQTDRLAGFEALVRWNHPRRGTISPAEFIPLAEETGMILALSEWILTESVLQLRAWQASFPDETPLTMSMNVSSKPFLQDSFLEKVEQIITKQAVPKGSFIIEITESVLMDDAESAVRVMERLGALGVGIHIDDFGTGYSSLSYLHNFPVSALKIDRSFVSSLNARGDAREIIRTIIALARSLKLEVIAEGIEQDKQLSAIKAMDCNFGQGYLYSKPLAPHSVEQWMRSYRTAASMGA